jgi:hypothetical protein
LFSAIKIPSHGAKLGLVLVFIAVTKYLTKNLKEEGFLSFSKWYLAPVSEPW